MSSIFVYRNCFTGDVSGGDMHTGGVCDWIDSNRPEHPLYLVHAADDGQEKAFRETRTLREITYPDTSVTAPALMFPLRAMKANKTALPWNPDSNMFISGSHFIPDVWPALGQGKKAPGAKKAVYIHHIIQDMPRPKNLNTLMANLQEKFCFDLIKYHFDKIITVNQDVVDGLRRRGFTQPILVSSNFVNDHQTKPVPYEKKDITFVFVGRLVAQKGIDDFLHICEQLQPYIPGFKAVMVGAGPEMERVKQTIQQRGLNIEVTGFVTEGRKFELMSRSKIFIFPSVEEGWGIVIAESLSVGTPVIAYDLPVYGEPFGEVIKTVPLSDRDKLTEAVKHQLATYQKNPAAYNQEQLALLQRASHYSRDSVVRKEFEFLMGDIDE
jgi:glycosyltransferase involved in cell wall biosynthesis